MHDAKYFFKAVREGDVVTFATNEENERHSWVQALYRATGQSHKPTPPITATNKTSQTAAGTGQKDHLGKIERNFFFSIRIEQSISMYSIGQLQVTRTQSYDLVERANYFRSLFKLIPAKQCDI